MYSWCCPILLVPSIRRLKVEESHHTFTPASGVSSSSRFSAASWSADCRDLWNTSTSMKVESGEVMSLVHVRRADGWDWCFQASVFIGSPRGDTVWWCTVSLLRTRHLNSTSVLEQSDHVRWSSGPRQSLWVISTMNCILNLLWKETMTTVVKHSTSSNYLFNFRCDFAFDSTQIPSHGGLKRNKLRSDKKPSFRSSAEISLANEWARWLR